MRMIVVFSAAFCLAGCDFSYSKRIDGPYVASAIDNLETMAVCYRTSSTSCSVRIPETVVAVGWNRDFIVASRRSRETPSALEYYYVVRSLDDPRSNKEAVRGPFDAVSFEAEAARLGLPPLMRDVPFRYLSDEPRSAALADIIR